MTSRYECWLNNIALADLNPDIYIVDIGYQISAPSRSTTKLAGRDGAYSGRRDSIERSIVAVNFLVRKYRTDERNEVVQEIAAWAANGGWLKTSDRPTQRMHVVCTRLPVVGTARNWTDTLTVEFTAFDYPYWQDEHPKKLTLNRGGNGHLYCSGIRAACVEATITAKATLTSVTLTCGETTLKLSGISVANGNTIDVRYTEDHHILEIKSGTSSLLDKRTSDSDDDLMASPGRNYCTFTANANATCEVRVKGVYV